MAETWARKNAHSEWLDTHAKNGRYPSCKSLVLFEWMKTTTNITTRKHIETTPVMKVHEIYYWDVIAK